MFQCGVHKLEIQVVGKSKEHSAAKKCLSRIPIIRQHPGPITSDVGLPRRDCIYIIWSSVFVEIIRLTVFQTSTF